jgi:hypothetical protein
MADLVLVSEALKESGYSSQHIRHLIRNGLVVGRKQGGIWLVDLDDLKRYELEMQEAGSKKFDPTKYK